jgi:rhomboid protease GluP
MLGTLPVHFSDPRARFGAQAQEPWKLVGPGEISFEEDRVVLRGGKTEIAIPLTDIVNVIRERNLVQCHVRTPFAKQSLRLWSDNEEQAEQLVQALPKERTPEFEKEVAEHSAFYAALATLGTRDWVTRAIVFLNIAIVALTVYGGAGLVQPNGEVLVRWGTNYGPLTLDGEWWRLFTSMFLHFGVLHIALNMWALWDLGQLTEKLYGSAHFLVMYVFAGVAGSLASLYVHPNVNSAGASGAIFGVLGALIAFTVNPKTRIPAGIAAAHRNSAGVFLAYNLINGFINPVIDNAAHIGGLIGGFAMGWVLARPVNLEARREPQRHLAVRTLGGAALLVALSWPLFH